MVYHQAIPSFPHRHYFIHLPHQLHKRGKLIILVKGVGGAIAPIQDMVKKRLVLLVMLVAYTEPKK
jgi:hypothetical protein